MSSRGYQIIEPDIIGKWLGTKIHQGILYCLLVWLVNMLKQQDKYVQKLSEVEIEIIEVKYIDSYPAIGIHYKNPNTEDLHDYVTLKIEEYLKEISVSNFLNYAFNSNISWEQQYKEFIKKS